MRSLSVFLVLQQFQPCHVLATHVAALLAQATPYIPAYFENSPGAPRPTSPPQIPRHLRQLLPRDAATCGYLVANGAANVCAESQYCTTIATGSYGVWNCCNPDSCYLEPACVDFSSCPSNYCQTSYMSITGTLLSRFMCGDLPSTIYMAYRFEDTPQYTSSLQAASRSSQAAANSAAAASASDAAKSAAEASSRASESAQKSSQAAAFASSISAAEASLSRAKASSARITVVLTTTKNPVPTSTNVPGTTDVPQAGKKISGGTIAGAVVGAGVGAALIGVVAFILYRIRKKRREDGEDDDIPHMTGVPVADKRWTHSQSGTLASSQY